MEPPSWILPVKSPPRNTPNSPTNRQSDRQTDRRPRSLDVLPWTSGRAEQDRHFVITTFRSFALSQKKKEFRSFGYHTKQKCERPLNKHTYYIFGNNVFRSIRLVTVSAGHGFINIVLYSSLRLKAIKDQFPCHIYRSLAPIAPRYATPRR